MAIPDSNKRMKWRELMQKLGPVANTVSKHDIFDTITALDAWIDDNASAVNQAIPIVPRQGLTARQKALIFFAVAEARFDVEA